MSGNYKVYVSQNFFSIPRKGESASTSLMSFKFNVAVDVMTSYLSDVTVHLRNKKHDSVESFMKSRSVTKEIRNPSPRNSFSFEGDSLNWEFISEVISNSNIPFSLDKLEWKGSLREDWIPLKNQDDMIRCILDITNSKRSSVNCATKPLEYTLLLKITKETIVTEHEFQRMLTAKRVEELARDVTATISMMNQEQVIFGRPFSRSVWEETIYRPLRERAARFGVDSYESLVDLAINLAAEQAGCRMVPALKSSVEALAVVVLDGDSDSTVSCSVCLQPYGQLVTAMPCSHKFHKNCIRSWLERSHVCPLCRYQLPTM